MVKRRLRRIHQIGVADGSLHAGAAIDGPDEAATSTTAIDTSNNPLGDRDNTEHYRQQLTALLTVHAPHKLKNVDIMLGFYEGREEEMMADVTAKYVMQPVEIHSSTTVGQCHSVTPVAEGVSAHFLHQWALDDERGFAGAQQRLLHWTAELAFADPVTGEVAATPKFTPGSGWSIRVLLPSGRTTFVALTRDGNDVPGTTPHLPGYAFAAAGTANCAHDGGRELTEAEREQVFRSWLPGYSQSTRCVWDESVDPIMFEGSSWEMRAEWTGCTTFIEVLRRQSPELEANFGPTNAMISHALENSFESLDRAVQLYVQRQGLDPRKFFVWLDGFSLNKAVECTSETPRWPRPAPSSFNAA